MEVVFYKLSKKFVDSSRSVPEASREVMYYSLAVGHHTGVIDCFSEAFRCELASYREFCAPFRGDEQAYYKLMGVERRGEIQLDRSHLALFEAHKKTHAPDSVSVDTQVLSPAAQKVSEAFWQFIDAMRADCGLYLMVRQA